MANFIKFIVILYNYSNIISLIIIIGSIITLLFSKLTKQYNTNKNINKNYQEKIDTLLNLKQILKNLKRCKEIYYESLVKLFRTLRHEKDISTRNLIEKKLSEDLRAYYLLLVEIRELSIRLKHIKNELKNQE
jgi:hypothetical protein